MIEHHFGESEPLSLGVEEEIMILDAETLMPAASVETLVNGSDPLDLPGRLKTELHASVVELNTKVCRDGEEAFSALRALRGAASDIAAEGGLVIAAAGAHPLAHAEDLIIVPEPRYLAFVEYAGISAIRQGVNGLHVHVGMPGAEECMTTLETLLPWMPFVLAASANSPFMSGRATGLASNRAEILAQLPRSGAPPIFDGYGGWETWIEGLVATGLLKDYTQVWWDVRPHPRFGTLEVRMPDQPTGLDRTASFVALLRDLCAWALEHPAPEPADRGIYQQNRWAAARYGPDAELIHDGRLVRVRELYGELPVETSLDPALSEGALQLEQGDAGAACADIVRRTWPS